MDLLRTDDVDVAGGDISVVTAVLLTLALS
jgi:hypothetical protein